jgi:hypothetical protein
MLYTCKAQSRNQTRFEATRRERGLRRWATTIHCTEWETYSTQPCDETPVPAADSRRLDSLGTPPPGVTTDSLAIPQIQQGKHEIGLQPCKPRQPQCHQRVAGIVTTLHAQSSWLYVLLAILNTAHCSHADPMVACRGGTTVIRLSVQTLKFFPPALKGPPNCGLVPTPGGLPPTSGIFVAWLWKAELGTTMFPVVCTCGCSQITAHTLTLS